MMSTGRSLQERGLQTPPAVEICFKNRRFPVETLRPDKYMKIKSKHFGYSENSTFIAAIEPPQNGFSAFHLFRFSKR